MRSYWSDPYLWVHLAGIATVPLMVELCLIGFAVGDPFLPAWLELLLVGAIGIAPIVWMQWQRPFYIFSLLAVSLKPEQLTEDQRRLLTLFKSQRNRVVAAIAAVVLLLLLQRVYGLAPIAVSVSLFPSEWRLAGLIIAAVGFLACNLFTQVPVAVLGVMLHSDAEFAATNPYSLEQIRSNFSVYGFRVNQILPPLVAATPLVAVATPAAVPSPPVQQEVKSVASPESEPVDRVDLTDISADTPDLSDTDLIDLTDTDLTDTPLSDTPLSDQNDLAAAGASTETILPETDVAVVEMTEPTPDQVASEIVETESVDIEAESADMEEISDLASETTLDVTPESTVSQSGVESETDHRLTATAETEDLPGDDTWEG